MVGPLKKELFFAASLSKVNKSVVNSTCMVSKGFAAGSRAQCSVGMEEVYSAMEVAFVNMELAFIVMEIIWSGIY